MKQLVFASVSLNIQTPNIANNIRKVASSLLDLSRNIIPVRVGNVSEKTNVIKKGDVLVILQSPALTGKMNNQRLSLLMF